MEPVVAAHQFCRDVCIERGEPMVGTGNLADRIIMLAWPRGKWRVPRYESVDMSPALAKAIQAAMAADVHVALVDRVGDSDRVAKIQADGIVGSYADETALAAAIDRYVAGEPLEGTPDPRTVILCCTDSRRDACCARFGFAAFKALRDQADPTRFSVLQCTHIGGCRFAASIAVLPVRQRYGRLSPEQVPDFLAAIGQGQIYLPAFRGRAGLPETAQLAEHATMSWAAEHGIVPAGVVLRGGVWPDTGEGAEGEEIVRETVAGTARLRITLQSRSGPMTGTCAGLSEPPNMKPRWHVANLDRIG